jgi:hypothetical protein
LAPWFAAACRPICYRGALFWVPWTSRTHEATLRPTGWEQYGGAQRPCKAAPMGGGQGPRISVAGAVCFPSNIPIRGSYTGRVCLRDIPLLRDGTGRERHFWRRLVLFAAYAWLGRCPSLPRHSGKQLGERKFRYVAQNPGRHIPIGIQIPFRFQTAKLCFVLFSLRGSGDKRPRRMCNILSVS